MSYLAMRDQKEGGKPMLSGIKNFFIKKFLFGWVKKLLDKVPADGKKTLVGVAILLLGAVASGIGNPDLAPILEAIARNLSKLPHDELQNTGIGVMVVGLVHKLLKYFDKDKTDSKA